MSRLTRDHLSDLIPVIAKKYKLTDKEAEVILRSQFEFLVDEISNGDFSNIKLKHLGKFIVNEKRKNRGRPNGNIERMGKSPYRKNGNTQNRVTEISTQEKKDM